MGDPLDPPVRVNRAYVVIELSDGRTTAYAINMPTEVIQTNTVNRDNEFDPFRLTWSMGPALTYNLEFEFSNVPEYRMVLLEPGVWQGFNFDPPAIAAGESRD